METVAITGMNAGPLHTPSCGSTSSFIHQSDPSGITVDTSFQIGGCPGFPQPVTGLLAARSGAQVALQWDAASDVETAAYDVWSVVGGDETLVPRANRPTSVTRPTEVLPVCLGVPRAAPACSDGGAANASGVVFYQVRGACGDGTEGTDYPF